MASPPPYIMDLLSYSLSPRRCALPTDCPSLPKAMQRVLIASGTCFYGHNQSCNRRESRPPASLSAPCDFLLPARSHAVCSVVEVYLLYFGVSQKVACNSS